MCLGVLTEKEVVEQAGPPGPSAGASRLDDSGYPAYAMGAAAEAISVSPAFLRAVEAAGLFAAHRSDGGHRRYTRDDLQRADRARHLVDDGMRLDAAVRIVNLEYQLAAARAMIEILRRQLGEWPS
jgi:MerR family transcriptional regulator, heat shock protein HspR